MKLSGTVINKNTNHMFTDKMLLQLLVPLMLEQLLNCLMGTVDTMMVSNVGSAAISAVSLVDSINILVIQVFAALAAGGTIICAQFIGKKNHKGANDSARQILLSTFVISLVITILVFVLRVPLLHLIFGQVEEAVFANSEIYFAITVMSYPFLALFNSGAAIYRAEGNSKFPMKVSVISNVMNVTGNAFMIFALNMGVSGAAVATLISRAFCAIVILTTLRNKKEKKIIVIRDYLKIRPDFKLISMILSVGIPAGIENGMFQFGKLAIQSTVSTMGTVMIAAQAMTILLEALNGIAAIGIGMGLMTIIGQCIGAGRPDEAKYYMKRVTVFAEIVVTAGCLFTLALTRPVTALAGMEPAAANECVRMMTYITMVKPFVWVLAFVPVNGLRAAGDVKFPMIVSTVIMWAARVALCVALVRIWNFGPFAVWIGMFTDWTLRAIIFTIRVKDGKWLKLKLV